MSKKYSYSLERGVMVNEITLFTITADTRKEADKIANEIFMNAEIPKDIEQEEPYTGGFKEYIGDITLFDDEYEIIAEDI